MKIETQKKIINYIPIVNVVVTGFSYDRLRRKIKGAFSFDFRMFLKVFMILVVTAIFSKFIQFTEFNDLLYSALSWSKNIIFCYVFSNLFICEQEHLLKNENESN